MNRFAIALAGALLGAAGFAGSANAALLGQSLAVWGGSETFTVTGCSAAASLCDSLNLVGDGTGYGVTIQYGSGGGSILSSSGVSDVSLDLTVTGTHLLSSIGASITGSDGGNVANDSAATLSEYIYDDSDPSIQDHQVALLNQGLVYASLPSGYTTLDISKDVNIATGNVVGGPVTITGITQTIKVPEPATISLMLAGLMAAAASRRKRRRA
jgi:PEP-CTERM motif